MSGRPGTPAAALCHMSVFVPDSLPHGRAKARIWEVRINKGNSMLQGSLVTVSLLLLGWMGPPGGTACALCCALLAPAGLQAFLPCLPTLPTTLSPTAGSWAGGQLHPLHRSRLSRLS